MRVAFLLRKVASCLLGPKGPDNRRLDQSSRRTADLGIRYEPDIDSLVFKITAHM